MSTHLVIPDSHSHPDHNNDRADWLAGLIKDVNPDVVIHIGDSADLASLSSYDKGKRAFTGRNYRADIDAHLDFQERVWAPVRATKRKLPYRRIFLIGNHEQRIERALDLSPELVGTIGYADLDLARHYTEVVPYTGSTPGAVEVDGILYAHYVASGAMGRAIGGERIGSALLAKKHVSYTVGHSHILDYSVRTTGNGNRIHGLSCGVFQDYDSDWAGREICNLWWRGVVVKRNVENGQYDPQFISIEALRKEYGNVR